MKTIALVGRPNAGKSTLFNRLTHSRASLVFHLPGVTKDRIYAKAHFEGRSFRLIDTAGYVAKVEKGSLNELMKEQLFLALHEADAIIFLLDGRFEPTLEDHQLLLELRKSGKPFVLGVNKLDPGHKETLAPFYAMGLTPYELSSAHGRGVAEVLEAILDFLPSSDEALEELKGTKIAIFGRPNAGKSTLLNRWVQKEQQIVFDQPGTTTDSVYIPFEKNGKPFVLIDTAGIRRRRSVHHALEKFAVLKALSALEEADVAVLVLDAKEGITDQDIRLMEECVKLGRAMVIALNKWDALTSTEKVFVRNNMDQKIRGRLTYEIMTISALHGSGVGTLLEALEDAAQSSKKTFETSRLMKILFALTEAHNPPRGVLGRFPKLKFIHQSGTMPPSLVIHGNPLLAELSDSYLRYLAGGFRKALKLSGTPVRFTLVWKANPYGSNHEKRQSGERVITL